MSADLWQQPLEVVGGPKPRVVRLRRDDEGWWLEPTDETSAGFISPGWIDLHAHVFDAFTDLGVPADDVGLNTGVHLVADAGSAGAFTVAGLAKYVVPAARTRIAVWLNIGARGLVDLREVADIRDIDLDRAVGAARAYPELVRGIKVRASGAIVGSLGTQPLELGRLVANDVGLPLMVHIGEAPPVIERVLDLLRPGDVVTHCFHGKLGTPWTAHGEPVQAMRVAIDRGVLLDVGHGAASFSGEVGRRAIAAGVKPHTISTDIHIRNIGGPVHDLPTTMSKFLNLGMTLGEVVAAVTANAASALRLDRPWLVADRIAHATVFSVDKFTDRVPLVDTGRRRIEGDLRITPRAVIADDRLIKCGSDPAEPSNRMEQGAELCRSEP